MSGIRPYRLFSILISVLLSGPSSSASLSSIGHLIVIYQENWSFDGLYGRFPGADGWAGAGATLTQTGRDGRPLTVLPAPLGEDRKPDPRLAAPRPVAPYDLAPLIGPEARTGDLVHRFYQEQQQIHGGAMDRFVEASDNGGLVLSYYDATGMPEGKLAAEFTLCDRFFHSAFGGSFLNHLFFVAAAPPPWPDAPAAERAVLAADGSLTKDGRATPDGFAVNTAYPAGGPISPKATPATTLPGLTIPTIGDRLTAAGVDWGWFAGGWDEASAGHPGPLFQIHHQPFCYFRAYQPGTPGRAHLRDEREFLALAKAGRLPPVCFVKPAGEDNEHPGYAALERGQRHVAELVAAVRASPAWRTCVIVITYDEHGGRFDHVPPPARDRWGPGIRVPTIVVSPFVRRGYVDHQPYETLSILKLIEERFGLPPLTERDAAAPSLAATLTFPSGSRRSTR